MKTKIKKKDKNMNLFSRNYDENEPEESLETEEFLASKDHSIESQIQLILKRFDFKKVLQVFEIFNFQYAKKIKKGKKEIIEHFIPDEEYLSDFATSLLLAAAEKGKEDKQEYCIASGGFEATYFPEDENLALKWVLEERETVCDEPNELVYVI
jgi:hypothetical protein